MVFDPFAGVSSTMMACKLFNRSGLAYELDPHFYDLSIKRLDDEDHVNVCHSQLTGGLSYSDCGLLSFSTKKISKSTVKDKLAEVKDEKPIGVSIGVGGKGIPNTVTGTPLELF